MSTKALKTQLLAAIAMVLVASIALGSSTYAWFASNNKVTADGMSVQATTAQSLVIDTDCKVDAKTTANFTAHSTALTPITYDTATYKYCSNGEDIDPATGLAITGKTVALTEVPTGSVDSYYKDYVVYIASAGSEMTGKTLKANVTFNTATSTQKAVTVDFKLFDAVSTDLTAQPVATERTVTTNAANSAEVTLGTGLTIPQNTGNSSIPILMRVYFDGALTGNTENSGAFVYTNSVNTTALGFSVEFSVV